MVNHNHNAIRETIRLLETDKKYAQDYWSKCFDCSDKYHCLNIKSIREKLAYCYLEHSMRELFGEEKA